MRNIVLLFKQAIAQKLHKVAQTLWNEDIDCAVVLNLRKEEWGTKMGSINGDRAITIHDVARELGVSASTVSRAISGKGRIGEATRERVLRYIDETGFYPNAAAQSLAQARTNNIAIILPEVKTLVDMPFFHTCMFGVEEVAQANDYDILVVTTSRKDTRPLERLILNRKVDGMILTRTYENDFFAHFLKEKKIPFVTVGQLDDKDIIQVDSDNKGACKALMNKLFEKDIQNIAYLGGNMQQTVNRCRYEGYLEAYRQNGRRDVENLTFLDLEDEEMIAKAVDQVLKANVDCILCQDDFICDEVIRRLGELDVKIPEDIKIASCHYSRVLDKYPASITSLNFDIMKLGRKACQLLLDTINNMEVPMKTLLDYEILMKDSTN